jgi:hypothetical protein
MKAARALQCHQESQIPPKNLKSVTVDAVSTIRLLESIEALYPLLVLIHVFLDNARYHHARLV